MAETRAWGFLGGVGRRFPSRIPAVNRLIPRFAGSSVKTDRSYRVFSTTRLVRFTEMEYAIPREAGPEALRRVLDLIERRGFPVPLLLALPRLLAHDGPLTPAYARLQVLHVPRTHPGTVAGPHCLAGR